MKQILILLLFNIIFVDSQIKLNKKSEVEILFLSDKIYLNKMLKGENLEVKIINNTNCTYIIDPYSFREDNNVVDSKNNFILPIKYFTKGYYERFDDQQCEEDLIILKPKEEKLAKLSIFTIRGNYDINNGDKYYLKLQSFENRYTVIQYGCENYINTLEKKGYKMFEDIIEADIPFYP
ncbi:hypothetical protein [Epilithonimonas hungarica]|uniref:Uncharacterized protein n=1 Tax=Epilithonimonas hungarica TaxID=454006 RepID=A0A1G7LLZ9_9FLAO|nr:hypothetical protein [Epilithonimonas hungarica]SDF50572.1 hypothetical protein SAMN05421825_1543 [Epilithonimonas hungarica]